MTNQNSRLSTSLLLSVLAALSLVAFGVPDRMLSRWSYAVEKGRIHAVGDQLSGVEEVGNTFRMVARAARPGVVQIAVGGDNSAAEQLAELNEKEREIRAEWERLKGDDDRDARESRAADLFQELLKLNRDREELRERLSQGTGSGIILNTDGYILTNNHVVGGRGKIRVRLLDDREYEGKLIGTDRKTDLAVIKIDAGELHALKFGDSDQVEVGDWVLAVGAPFGLTQSVTHGILSAKGRTDIVSSGDIMYQDFLQTDAAINPGNSGGPLLNIRGEVVGINTAIASDGAGVNAGVAFTIPSKLAQRIAKELMNSGSVARGWLGVSLSQITKEDAVVLGVDSPGVMIDRLYKGAPAEQAGLQPEDVILSVAGQRVTEIRKLQGLIADVPPGGTTKVRYWRDGAESEIDLNVGTQPDDINTFAQRSDSIVSRRVDKLPLSVRTLLPDNPLTRAGLRHVTAKRQGVYIVETDSSRGADSYNLSAGELITAVGGQKVASYVELIRALDRAGDRKAIELEVVDTDGEKRTVEYRR